jgi:DNA-directed RNA polymerase subunit RPC12/RpoP
VPYTSVQCPRCGAIFPIPLVPSTTRQFNCQVCGSLLECTIDYNGRIRVSCTSFEEKIMKEVMEKAIKNIDEFKRIGGMIFCPYCGFDITSEKIRREIKESIAIAYTICSKCGRQVEWASIQI